jgi:hypothetical protein
MAARGVLLVLCFAEAIAQKSYEPKPPPPPQDTLPERTLKEVLGWSPLGMKLNDVRKKVAAAGYKLDVQVREAADEKFGIVLDYSIGPQEAGEKFSVHVGAVKMPQFVGSPLKKNTGDLVRLTGLLGASSVARESVIWVNDNLNVISQSPDAGALVLPGATVTIRYPYNPDVAHVPDTARVGVPNVVGKSEAEAESMVKAAGLTCRTTTVPTSSRIEDSKVRRIDPPPETRVLQGGSVDLQVWKYLGYLVLVPDGLVGLSRGAAEVRLMSVELEPVFHDSTSNDSARNTEVFRVAPPSGTKLRSGDTVHVYYYRYSPAHNPAGFAGWLKVMLVLVIVVSALGLLVIVIRSINVSRKRRSRQEAAYVVPGSS